MCRVSAALLPIPSQSAKLSDHNKIAVVNKRASMHNQLLHANMSVVQSYSNALDTTVCGIGGVNFCENQFKVLTIWRQLDYERRLVGVVTYDVVVHAH